VRTEFVQAIGSPHVTICQLTLANGYVLTGQSAPADPANYDEVKGRQFSYEDALRKLWPIQGYLLCEALHVRRRDAAIAEAKSKAYGEQVAADHVDAKMRGAGLVGGLGIGWPAERGTAEKADDTK
jgi:Phage protein (N4 Gp49/phage Sf6 gene 66) family